MKIIEKKKINEKSAPSIKTINDYFNKIEDLKYIIYWIEKYSSSKVGFISGIEESSKNLSFNNVNIAIFLSQPLLKYFNQTINGIKKVAKIIEADKDMHDITIQL